MVNCLVRELLDELPIAVRKVSVKDRIAVAQLGSRQDYTVPIALQRGGTLERFFTDFYLSPTEAYIVQLANGKKKSLPFAKKALSRYNPVLDYSKVTRFVRLGINYMKDRQKHTHSAEAQYQTFMKYGQALNKAILQSDLPEATHLYAFDHAALGLFNSEYAKGRLKILDQIYPALFEETLEQEEEDLWPDWPYASRRIFFESQSFQQWREIQLQEWQLADTIIVASEYSKNAVTHFAPAIQSKLKIVPLTVNLNSYRAYQKVRHYQKERPLNVLFAGTVGLRKGIQYLLSAFDQIKASDATLTVAGNLQINREKLSIYQDKVNFYGSIPHIQMPQIYSEADLFVFPTISDGFGAVMLEAMATGLPVIATDHCGDIVEDGINGFRISIRRVDAIVEKIYEIIRSPELLEHLSRGAIATTEKFSLNAYQAKLYQALGIANQDGLG